VPRNSGFAVQNQFVRGLITEATGYNFPEDAATDTENCVFEKTGEVRRRLGIDFEDGFEIYESAGDVGAITEYIWRHVGEDGRQSFVCVQQGDGISFYEVDSNGNVGANVKDFSISLDTYKVAGAPDVSEELCQFTSGFGFLFVTHPYCDPIRVEYSFDDDDITIEVITVEIRDTEGVEDNLGVATRPSSLSVAHKYNLYNQGWYAEGTAGGDKSKNVLGLWRSNDDHKDDYPSNADIWWLFKHVDIDTGKEVVDFSDDRNSISLGNTPAPKGHYIMYAFNQQRSSVVESDYAINRHDGLKSLEDTVTNFGVIENETSGFHRPITCAFYAGRVWYSGVRHQRYNQKLYFSQVLEEPDKAGRCFPNNDPTSEDISDLLDTDGGVITIAEATEIIKLLPVRNFLLVFATNGVWAISGGQGAGFLATDYAIDKLSDVGVISQTSIVPVEGLPQWWNYDGINGLFPDDAGISLRVRSLSDDTIRTYYTDTIPVGSRRYAKGAYNSVSKIVQWIWRSADVDTFSDNFKYDRILNLNILTGAFYPWTLNDDNIELSGIFVIDNSVGLKTEVTVTNSDGETVVNSASETVTASLSIQSVTASKFKYILSL
jgi:hypothetical protein